MKTMKTIDFIKMHGLGNDFVILDARVQVFEKKEDLSKKLGNRHLGVGCDQIIFIEKSDRADVFMRIYNPDGSEAGACGNATRCVADIQLKEIQKQNCTIETRAGVLKCVQTNDGMITVDMGEPKIEWQQIPLSKECDTINLPIGGSGVLNPVAVNMGNPHCVFFVDDIDQIDITKIGRGFEYNPIFPERANIEFVEVIDKGHVRMRVWERGAGITLACGSGACATAVAAIRRGLTGRTVIVSMDGGDLTLEWRESDNHVYMTGPVKYVFKGNFIVGSLAH
jgi:diaminopimelate epimerase